MNGYYQILSLVDKIKDDYINIDSLIGRQLVSYFGSTYPTRNCEALVMRVEEARKTYSKPDLLEFSEEFESKLCGIFGDNWIFNSSKIKNIHSEINEVINSRKKSKVKYSVKHEIIHNPNVLEYAKRDAKIKVLYTLGAICAGLNIESQKIEYSNITEQLPYKQRGRRPHAKLKLSELIEEGNKKKFLENKKLFLSEFKNFSGKKLAYLFIAMKKKGMIKDLSKPSQLHLGFNLEFNLQIDNLRGFTDYLKYEYDKHNRDEIDPIIKKLEDIFNASNS